MGWRDGVSWSKGEGWKHGKLQGRGWMAGAGGVTEGCDEEGRVGWKCGGGWEAMDGCNGVGRDTGKGTCIPGATPGIYGGKKEVDGEIVTLTCLCTRTCIHIHGLVY